MKKAFRGIVFIIPAVPSAAGEMTEMALDFLSRVEWLRDDLRSLGADIYRQISHAVRSSARTGHGHAAVSIDLFPADCVIRVSQRAGNAKQVTIHLTRGLAKRPELEEDVLVNQEVCVS